MMKSILKMPVIAGLILLGFNCSVNQKIVGNKTGDLAPDISAKDTNGETITLSSLRGKIVLLEFWDSENSQSRQNHAEIQRLYEKYRDVLFRDGNGLAVYSFSIDTEKEKWISAIKADRTTWPCHVCDFKSWNSKAILDYQLGVMPKYYLIDGNGVILRRNILIQELSGILADYQR